MKVLVTGASGLIGSALCDSLLARGDEVVGLSRDPEQRPRAPTRASPGTPGSRPSNGRPPTPSRASTAVVNLRRREDQPALDRRGQAADHGDPPHRRPTTWSGRSPASSASPRSWSASRRSATTATAATRSSTRRPGRRRQLRLRGRRGVGEGRARGRGGRGAPGDRPHRPGPRPRGGMLGELSCPFKLGVGGPLAGGEQYVSWIHLDDEIGILLWALDTDEVSGVVNATAPNPVTNQEFSKALGRALGRPAVLPIPGLRRSTSNSAASSARCCKGGQRVVPSADRGARLRVPVPRPRRGARGPALARQRFARQPIAAILRPPASLPSRGEDRWSSRIDARAVGGPAAIPAASTIGREKLVVPGPAFDVGDRGSSPRWRAGRSRRSRRDPAPRPSPSLGARQRTRTFTRPTSPFPPLTAAFASRAERRRRVDLHRAPPARRHHPLHSQPPQTRARPRPGRNLLDGRARRPPAQRST